MLIIKKNPIFPLRWDLLERIISITCENQNGNITYKKGAASHTAIFNHNFKNCTIIGVFCIYTKKPTV